MTNGATHDKFKMTILSPTGHLLDQQIVMAILPGQEGEFGVLARHAALTTPLKAGVIKIYRESKDQLSEELRVQGGVVSIHNDHCEVLLSV